MEQGDVLDTEEAVAAEFAFGGPAASYRNQWLCVKAAFTQKNGIVFLGTALGAKSVAANVINEWFPGRRTPKSTTQQCTQPPSARALLLLLIWVCGI